MSNRLNDIQAQLLTQLATIDGTGGYTYDLSPAGRVFVGASRPDGGPDLCVWLYQGEIRMDPEGDVPLGVYRWSVTYGVAGFVPATADTPQARIMAANHLFADLWTCIHGNRALNNGTRDLVYDIGLAEMQSLDGASVGFSGVGVCSFTLTMFWQATDLT